MSDVWIVLIGVSAGWVLSVFTPAVTQRLTKKRGDGASSSIQRGLKHSSVDL